MVRLCILAAFADGALSEVERAEIKRIADNFYDDLNLAGIYQEALSGKGSPAQAAAEITSPNGRALAWELAACICHADGALSPAEEQFLNNLRQTLALDPAAASSFSKSAAAIQAVSTEKPPVIADHDLDQMIVNRAILAGALELMPQRLATMAILPVQMRMVYSIGKKYGYDLDWTHAREFLATAGVGMASQMVEGYLARFTTGLAKKFVGKWAGSFAGQATESALAFGTTYALGQAAKAYYSGGRTLNTGQVRELFSTMVGRGQMLKAQYGGEILNRSRSLNVAELLPLLRKS
jgi:uncharacterized protein (DUF697 family)/tellurite resistance protein